MCFKPTQSERDAALEKERRQQREHEARGRQPTTRPRGNGQEDRRDMERSTEKFHAVLGR